MLGFGEGLNVVQLLSYGVEQGVHSVLPLSQCLDLLKVELHYVILVLRSLVLVAYELFQQANHSALVALCRVLRIQTLRFIPRHVAERLSAVSPASTQTACTEPSGMLTLSGAS